jgi:rod shape-determining protein MreD
MRSVVFLSLTAAAGLVQVAFLSQLRLFGAGPDLFLAMTVIAAVNLEARQALVIGLLNGLLKDVFDAGPFGVNAFIFPLIALLFSKLNRTLSLDTHLSCSLITAAAVIISGFAAWIILSFSQTVVPGGAFLRAMFLEAVLTALVIPPLFTMARSALRALR